MLTQTQIDKAIDRAVEIATNYFRISEDRRIKVLEGELDIATALEDDMAERMAMQQQIVFLFEYDTQAANEVISSAFRKFMEPKHQPLVVPNNATQPLILPNRKKPH